MVGRVGRAAACPALPAASLCLPLPAGFSILSSGSCGSTLHRPGPVQCPWDGGVMQMALPGHGLLFWFIINGQEPFYLKWCASLFLALGKKKLKKKKTNLDIPSAPQLTSHQPEEPTESLPCSEVRQTYIGPLPTTY